MSAPGDRTPAAADVMEPGKPASPRKFSDEAYARIDPAYELMDNGRIRSRATGEVRPHWYSGLPIPFNVGDKAKVVDSSWQFPLGKIGRITHIDQDIVYFDGVPCCWERLDPHTVGTPDSSKESLVK
jgi:hypothetical protein